VRWGSEGGYVNYILFMDDYFYIYFGFSGEKGEEEEEEEGTFEN
jgi:hypothetical protein